MNIKSSCILGGCIIAAAIIVSVLKPIKCCHVSNQENKECANRYQISNPGEKGHAFVVDTVTGQVWQIPVGMSGSSDGDRFFNKKRDKP